MSAVVAAVGENRLMPQPDCTCKVINAKTGYIRDNTSWVVGRIVRDFEHWRDPKVQEVLDKMLKRKWDENKMVSEKKNPGSGQHIRKPKHGGLCVSVYNAGDATPGFQGRDIVYFSGFAVAILQLALAAIPCGVWGDWSVLFITTCGIALSFATGCLPQWTKEKWACRKNESDKTVVLVRGNGCQHAIIIRSQGRGLDLEDLATGPINVDVHTSILTRVLVIIHAILWLLLLITASGIDQDTWFLLAVGGLGIIQNIYVAGRWRDPAAFGIPLIFEDAFAETKTMNTLYTVEDRYPGVGRSMLENFFPGVKLRPDEVHKWKVYEESAAQPAKPVDDSS